MKFKLSNFLFFIEIFFTVTKYLADNFSPANAFHSGISSIGIDLAKFLPFKILLTLGATLFLMIWKKEAIQAINLRSHSNVPNPFPLYKI